MSKLFTFLLLLLPFTLLAQFSNVGINTTTPDSSAVLDINSTDGGILIPRMTLFQRDVINNPARGLLVYQTDYNPGFYYYNGWRWCPFGSIGLNGITADSTSNSFQLGGPLIKNTTINTGVFRMVHDLTSGSFEINDANTSLFYAGNGGRIGLGTTAPTRKLDVNGAVRIRALSAGSTTDRIVVADANGVLKKIPASGLGVGDDADWFGEGTTSAPGAITDNIFTQGNVGIGDATPSFHLDVYDTAQAGIRINSGGDHSVLRLETVLNKGNYLRFHRGGTPSYWIYNSQSNDLQFRPLAGAATVVFKEDGKVGVGTTNPIESIHTTGNLRADGRNLYLGAAQRIYGDDASAIFYNSNSSTFTQMIFRDLENTTYGKVVGSGDGTNFGLTDGDNDWAYFQAKDDYTQFRIDNDPKMTIRATGNVGIGTVSPGGKLTLDVDPGQRGLEVLTSSGNTHIPWTNGWSYLSGEGIIFRTTSANTEQVRISSNGFTGFGTTAPAQRIHSAGNLRIDGRRLYFGATQQLYGDNSSAIYYEGAHASITQLILRDAAQNQQGRLYGSGSGANFGLLDGDGNWSIRAVKDANTRFLIDNTEHFRMTPLSLEFHNFSDNIAIGRGANAAGSISGNNIGIGINAFRSNSFGSNNIGLGTNAIRNNAIGNDNIGIGTNALIGVSNGYNNVGIGTNALPLIVNGSNNTAIGFNVAQDLISNIEGNTHIGAFAGVLLSGNGNTCLGWNAGVRNGTVTRNYVNSTGVGAFANITASYQVRLGTSQTTSIGGFRAWSNLSDGNFKTNIQNNVPGLDFIMKLKPVTYNFDIEKLRSAGGLEEAVANSPSMQEAEQRVKERLETGFIAQEVEQAAIELGYEFSGVDEPQNENDHYGLRYSTFVVPMVKAMQEQQALIEQQQQLIQELFELNRKLEGRLDALEDRGKE